MAGFFGGIVSLFFAACLAMLPVLFAAWIFSKAFQVTSYIKILSQIKNELKRLNDFNEGKKG